MIIYKDIFKKLRDAGYNTSVLRKNKLIPEGTLQNIRDGKMVNLRTIDTICKLSGCKIEELIEYQPDENTQKKCNHIDFTHFFVYNISS